MLVWLSVSIEGQTCICQLMPLPLTVSCFSKIQLGLPFWYWLTRVVPDKGPLNGCVCAGVCVSGGTPIGGSAHCTPLGHSPQTPSQHDLLHPPLRTRSNPVKGVDAQRRAAFLIEFAGLLRWSLDRSTKYRDFLSLSLFHALSSSLIRLSCR